MKTNFIKSAAFFLALSFCVNAAYAGDIDKCRDEDYKCLLNGFITDLKSVFKDISSSDAGYIKTYGCQYAVPYAGWSSEFFVQVAVYSKGVLINASVVGLFRDRESCTTAAMELNR